LPSALPTSTHRTCNQKKERAHGNEEEKGELKNKEIWKQKLNRREEAREEENEAREGRKRQKSPWAKI
jgi:hypothetical protein